MSMTKKRTDRPNMSIAVDTNTQDILKTLAEQKQTTVSKLVRGVIEKYLNVDNSFDTIVLKIPVELKSDSDKLREWIEAKIPGIVSSLTN